MRLLLNGTDTLPVTAAQLPGPQLPAPTQPRATTQIAATPPAPTPSVVTSAEVISWNEMDAASRNQWRVMRSTQDAFRTPFFSLEFIDAVHAARGDVRVIMLHDHHRLVGLLPIHQLGNVAVPAGRYFNDAHNVIADPQTQLDWMGMLRQCRLKSFDFHALVGNADGISDRCVMGRTESFRADLGTNSHDFLRSLERDHKTIRRQEQKTRKLEREVGPLTLEMDCRDSGQLAQVIDWKRDQYRRTNILDLFTPSWTRGLMHQLHDRPAEPMGTCSTRGVLSVLRAGDEVVAMHLGMIESGLLHYWFPVYDPQYSRYSPGTALFKAIVRSASEQGIHCVDMGYGEQPYKRKQTDTVTSVLHGCTSVSRTYRSWRRASHAASEAIKRIPMKQSLKQVLRRVQPNAGISKIR